MAAHHKKNDKDLELVTKMASVGITQEQIAKVMGVSADTLMKHYGEEFTKSQIHGLVGVAQTLYAAAMAGDITAAIFLAKTKLGWCEKNTVTIEGGILFGKVSSEPLSIDEWNKKNTIDVTPENKK